MTSPIILIWLNQLLDQPARLLPSLTARPLENICWYWYAEGQTKPYVTDEPTYYLINSKSPTDTANFCQFISISWSINVLYNKCRDAKWVGCLKLNRHDDLFKTWFFNISSPITIPLVWHSMLEWLTIMRFSRFFT